MDRYVEAAILKCNRFLNKSYVFETWTLISSYISIQINFYLSKNLLHKPPTGLREGVLVLYHIIHISLQLSIEYLLSLEMKDSTYSTQPKVIFRWVTAPSCSSSLCSGIQETLPRLTAMIRGIGDPLVAAYARAYLCRVRLDFFNFLHMLSIFSSSVIDMVG